MKVILVLALALAVANAAFTGSLVQRTQPLLNKAQLNMQMAVARNVHARNSVEAAFQTKFIQAIIDQAQGILGTITAMVEAGQQVGAELAASFQALMPELQNLAASFGDAASGIVQGLINDLMTNFNNIINGNSKRRSSIEITPQMAGILQMLLSNPTFLNMFRSEPMYLCLQSNGITVSFEHLQSLNAQGLLGMGLLDRPHVQQCLYEVGGIEAVISQSQTLKFLHGLAEQLGIKPLIVSAMESLLGSEMTQQIMTLISSRMRGFWDGLSNLWGTIVDTVSNGASSFADYIANLVGGLVDTAAAQLEQVQTMASLFIDEGIGAAQQLGQQGAQALVDFMTPFAQDLGASYDMIMEQLTGIYEGLVIPGWSKKF